MTDDGEWLACGIDVVSSRQPTDIPEFNRNMIELFSEARQKGRRAA